MLNEDKSPTPATLERLRLCASLFPEKQLPQSKCGQPIDLGFSLRWAVVYAHVFPSINIEYRILPSAVRCVRRNSNRVCVEIDVVELSTHIRFSARQSCYLQFRNCNMFVEIQRHVVVLQLDVLFCYDPSCHCDLFFCSDRVYPVSRTLSHM